MLRFYSCLRSMGSQPGTAGMSCVSPRPREWTQGLPLLLLHPGLPHLLCQHHHQSPGARAFGFKCEPCLGVTEVKLPNLCVPRFPYLELGIVIAATP